MKLDTKSAAAGALGDQSSARRRQRGTAILSCTTSRPRVYGPTTVSLAGQDEAPQRSRRPLFFLGKGRRLLYFQTGCPQGKRQEREATNPGALFRETDHLG